MTTYRLYIFLLDIAPPIWRRIELSSEASLAQLHKVLQTAMGWQDYHLHEFEIGDQRYGVPDPDYTPSRIGGASRVERAFSFPSFRWTDRSCSATHCNPGRWHP